MPSGGNLENESVSTWTNKQWSIMKQQTNKSIIDLISQIKQIMLQKTIQSEDW